MSPGIPANDGAYLQSLLTTRNAIARELALASTSRALDGGVMPRFTLQGKAVTSEEWRTAKLTQLKDLNEMIQALDPGAEVIVQMG